MGLSAGTKLGPYEILAPLGAGGMGEVWQARDTRLGRDVALKVLPGDFLESEEGKARFEREARALATLNHPNIAAVYSFEEISGRHLLAMELLEGETLRGPLVRGPLPVRKALDVAMQVAEGLAAAHGKGNRPPRRQARERLPDEGRARQAPRLRPRPARRHAPRGVRHPISHTRGRQREGGRPRDGGLHVAGTGARGDRRLPERPVLARRRHVRDAHRETPLRRGHRPPRCWPPSSGTSRSR